jgi:hypothetical protein
VAMMGDNPALPKMPENRVCWIFSELAHGRDHLPPFCTRAPSLRWTPGMTSRW